jgi:hypothetical protein
VPHKVGGLILTKPYVSIEPTICDSMGRVSKVAFATLLNRKLFEFPSVGLGDGVLELPV